MRPILNQSVSFLKGINMLVEKHKDKLYNVMRKRHVHVLQYWELTVGIFLKDDR